MFLPTTKDELKKLNIKQLDIILVSGDTYIDSSYNGTALIGKLLQKRGFKVGIIAQPNIDSDIDINRLGQPKLFWGVSAGCVDSMVANYTATKRRRKMDDFTPGGENTKRPDRAIISYVNLIKRFNKSCEAPIVIAGIEASLRRVVHYDFWSNKLRKSILFNSKADILSYGMGERSMVELANALKDKKDYKNIRGLAYISNEYPTSYIELPSFDECKNSKESFIKAFDIFYSNNDPKTAKGIVQKNDTRYYVQNPPAQLLNKDELDEVYSLDYERDVHPYYKKMGEVKAVHTIKNSVTTHRGCYGECNFCAIAVHQGRSIVERSENSILNEIEILANKKGFKGYISDMGGPTANMYGIECDKKIKLGSCSEKRCLYPKSCNALKPNHNRLINLLKKVRKINNVKKIFVASGIRYDMIIEDKIYGDKYLKEIVEHHVSGQMKIAPEHTEDKVLDLMGKPGKYALEKFKNRFYELNNKMNKKQFLTYYFIAAHPGCNEKDMKDLKKFASKELKLNPEQVQIFTPTPSTYSTLMYYTEMNPFTGEKLNVEKDINNKYKQKEILTDKVVFNNKKNNNKKRRVKK